MSDISILLFYQYVVFDSYRSLPSDFAAMKLLFLYPLVYLPSTLSSLYPLVYLPSHPSYPSILLPLYPLITLPSHPSHPFILLPFYPIIPLPSHPSSLLPLFNPKVKSAYQKLCDEKEKNVVIINIEHITDEVNKERKKQIQKGVSLLSYTSLHTIATVNV